VNQRNGVDQPRSATLVDAADCLAMFQVRVHAGLRIDEPDPEVPRCLFGARVIVEEPGRDAKRQRVRRHSAKIVVIVHEAIGIALAVAPDTRARRILGIRPEVMRGASSAIIISESLEFTLSAHNWAGETAAVTNCRKSRRFTVPLRLPGHAS